MSSVGVIRRIIPVLALILPLAYPSYGQKSASRGEKALPPLYDDVTDGKEPIDRAAEKAYAGKFKLVTVTAKEGLALGPLKGFPRGIRDPRSMREWGIPLKVGLFFVVTPDGVVIEPRFLAPLPKQVADVFLKSVMYRRYAPTRFRGVPVYSLHYMEETFGQQGDSRHGEVMDGLRGFGTR